VARVFLGLGSNLGDRESNLRRAEERLARLPGMRVLRRSRVYESAPVGPREQPWFLNAVLEVETKLDPQRLLAATQAIERALGRTPGPHWGPRVIDVDILLYDSVRLSTSELTLPHPEYWNRLFVLVPLAELSPHLRGPRGEPIRTRIERIGGTPTQSVRAYGSVAEPAEGRLSLARPISGRSGGGHA